MKRSAEMRPPLQVALRIADLRADRWWRSDPRVRADARLQMEAVVGALDDRFVSEAVGRSYVRQVLRRRELAWRTPVITTLPVRGIEKLRDAHAGSGVLVSFMHQGQYIGLPASISRHGFEAHFPVDRWFMEQKRSGVHGDWGRQHMHNATRQGARIFAAQGSFESMRQMLHANKVVTIACDVPGSTVVPFLNRPVGAASGTTQLSKQTGAPVLPVTSERRGSLQRFLIGDALLPDDYSDHAAMLLALLQRHEPAVRAWPEAIDRPVQRFRPVRAVDIAAYGHDHADYVRRFRV